MLLAAQNHQHHHDLDRPEITASEQIELPE
jgi:hypothetical protein